MMLLRRLWHLVNRRRFERELVEEMRDHRAAMRDPSRFGDTHRLIEQSRDAWGWNWLDDIAQDLAVGARTLLKAPAFAVTAALILTFGIGLNVTLHQMLQATVLRPPAITSPETFARFHRSTPKGSSTAVPYPLIQAIGDHDTALAAVVAEASGTVAFGPDAAEQVELSLVSPNWFDELGYGPAIGRVLSAVVDGGRGAAPVVVLGHEFWRTRLGANPAIVGSIVHLDRRPVTVVGVADPKMPGLDFDAPAIFMAIEQRDYLYPESDFLRSWETNTVAMYGRFRSGIPPAAGREALRATMQGMARERAEVKPEEWLEPLMASANFMRADERVQVFAVASMIFGLTALVLAVAAANLGNLVMSRATGRVRELGVRMALGARRSRIVRQLVVEAVPLVGLGALGSLLFAAAATRLIFATGALPPYLDLRIDWQTIGITTFLAGMVLAVVGLAPAWKVAQQQLIDALKDGGQHVSRTLDRALLRRVLMAAQVTGSCLLLIVAGMMARNVQRVLSSSLGFDYEPSAVLSMPLGKYGIAGDAARSYWYDVRDRVRSNPAVEAAAIVTSPPMGGRVYETIYDGLQLSVMSQFVEPSYFATMRIPLLSGRLFADGEAESVVVSRRLALEMYGTLEVLGQGYPKDRPAHTIVGVAADAHTIRIDATNVAELYRPLRPEDFTEVFLVARARGGVERLPAILREAATRDPRVIPTVSLLRDDFDRRMRGARIASSIVAGVGVLTLALACLGIFGVVSYGVTLRVKEIGIRVALGAGRAAVVRVVLRQVLAPIAAGILVAFAAAFPIGRAMSGEPFYVQHTDPIAFTGGLAVFAVTAALAALLPALAVLRRNPMDALRHS